MMKNYTLILAACLALNLNAQIITEVSSLPDVEDELNYQTLSSISESYLLDGENITWDFTEMYGDNSTTDVYASASEGPEAEQFPEADMLIQFAGANAYAKRNTTNIEVVGLGSGGLVPELDDIEAQGLSNPFVVRRAPVGFGDSFSGETDFSFDMWIDPESVLGQTLETFNPIEGATVDSLRATFTISRTENVDGWGTAVFQNAEIDALRLVQNDEISITVELFVNTADISTTTYIFLGATNKEHLLEVNVDNATEEVSGRYSSEYYVGISEENKVQVSVFPNPTADELLIDGVNISTYTILDQAGREVLTTSDRLVDVSELSEGTYFIQGETREGKLFFSRFVKQ